MLYDEISKQLQAAIKNKAQPRDLAVILAAFNLSKKQYKITNDLRSKSVYLCSNMLRVVIKHL